MKFRDILAIITSQAGSEHVIAFAEQLSRQNSGQVSAIVVHWQPNVAPVDGFVIDTMYADLVKEAYKHLTAETEKVKARLAREGGRGSVHPYLLYMGAAGPALGLHARHADVAVVARPAGANGDSAQTIFEAALFDSGRPVLVVPPGWTSGQIGRHVLVAWKPTREAARALADADDFVLGADRVSVVTVDAKPERDFGQQPGADITAHLARRGAKPDLYNLDSGGRTETKAILDQALAVGADLIVMGGYGRSRMSEFIFGGVTKEIVKTATVPVLMAH